MMRMLILIVLLLGSVCITPALAQMYKWVDKNGTVTFSDTPPPNRQGVTSVNVAPVQSSPSLDVSESAAAGNAGQIDAQSREETALNKVELYVTDWCPYCKKAENYFRQQNIDFTAYNIEKDPAANARKNELDSRKGVPFAVVNGVGIHGFSPARYKAALY